MLQKRPPGALTPQVVARGPSTQESSRGRTVVIGSCPHCGVQEDPVQGCCPGCQLGTELSGQPAGAFVDRAEGLLRSQRPEAALAHSSRDADFVAQYAHVVAALGHADLARQWAGRALELDGRCAKARELLAP